MEFKIVEHNSAGYLTAVKLREDILRKPLGLVFSDEEIKAEEIKAEENHIQLVGVNDGEICATAVLVPEGERIKMQRVVVAEGLQGQGIGSSMTLFCEGYVREKGFNEIYVHAREGAVEFYLKNGYCGEGEYFDEDTIPHLKMRKDL